MAYIYIIIGAEGSLTSEDRVKAISEELLLQSTLNKKPSDESKYLLGWIENNSTPGEFALKGDDEYRMNVNKSPNPNKLLGLYGDKVPASEKQALRDKLSKAANKQAPYEDRKIPLKDAIPSTTPKYTRQDMIDLGWFPK